MNSPSRADSPREYFCREPAQRAGQSMGITQLREGAAGWILV